MNDTERLFEQNVLKPGLDDGSIVAYYFERLTWLVAPGCRYTPDFLVIESDGTIKLYDVKGHRGRIGSRRPYMEDDARVKMKATDYYSPFPIFVAFEERAGQFKCEQISDE